MSGVTFFAFDEYGRHVNIHPAIIVHIGDFNVRALGGSSPIRRAGALPDIDPKPSKTLPSLLNPRRKDNLFRLPPRRRVALSAD